MTEVLNEKQLIDALLNDPGFVSLAEKELGSDFKVTVDWTKRIIVLQGRHEGRLFKIDEILQRFEIRPGVH